MPGKPFRPGLAIDWHSQTVYAAARVVLREGPLEFLACRPGKEHESILRLDGSAADLYMALGLAGFQPGQPPRWAEATQTYHPATGDLVDIRLHWTDAAGSHEAAPADWIEELEYRRPARDAPWVFAGSLQRDGRLAAEVSGAVIALVDFPESLLSLSQPHSDRTALLWAAARTASIPPLDTPVTLAFRRPTPRHHTVVIDFRGDAYVDDRYESPAAVIDVIRIAQQLNPTYVQRIELRAALHADARRWRNMLTARFPTSLRFETRPPEP